MLCKVNVNIINHFIRFVGGNVTHYYRNGKWNVLVIFCGKENHRRQFILLFKV